MKEELVSVIIPVYNKQEFIEDTIKSVLMQTYENLEIILVDDASTDNSVKIIEKYLRKNIKLIKLKENLGVAIARNTAIEKARGKYIALLDADDMWKKDKLEKKISFAEKNHYDFTFTGYERITEDGNRIKKVVQVPETINYKQALKNTIIATSGVVLNVESLGKDLIKMPNVRRGQDTATWWKILRSGVEAYGLNENLHQYRKNKNSLSRGKITSLKRTWNIYRNVENISFTKTCYYFPFYMFNAIKRRL